MDCVWCYISQYFNHILCHGSKLQNDITDTIFNFGHFDFLSWYSTNVLGKNNFFFSSKIPINYKEPSNNFLKLSWFHTNNHVGPDFS